MRSLCLTPKRDIFVQNQQSEILKFSIFTNQSMCPNRDIDLPLSQFCQALFERASIYETTEQ